MAANAFDVVAKVWTVATSFLRFCRADSDGVAFMVGTLGFECAVGVVYTRSGEGASGSGLFVAWAVDFWGFSIYSFPPPSSVSIGEVSSFCCLHCSSTVVSIRHSSSGFTSSW